MDKKIFADVVINESSKKDGEIRFADFDGGITYEAPFKSEEEFDAFFANPESILKL